jgi:hypothetical protein
MDPMMEFYFEDIAAGIVSFIFGLTKTNQRTIESLQTFPANAPLPLLLPPPPNSPSSR